MRKRKLLAQNKDYFHNFGSHDLLSRLPDEILVSILSSFPLRDAAVTSLLSRRWRYLWCQTDCLIFEDEKRWNLIQNELGLGYSNAERDKYISWVNHIIHQHKSPTIDNFKISFGLNQNDESEITKWIKFAISKDVQTLELNLTRYYRNGGNYCFPNQIFDRKCESSLIQKTFNAPVMEIMFLKSLILNFVDVNDEGLKKILSNCPVLEHLSILHSRKLVKAEIHGKGLALKTLDMGLCMGLKSIEIRDSNIVSFNSRGTPFTLRFDNLQMLEKLCLSLGYSLEQMKDIFCQISCCAPYLQVLELHLHFLLRGPIELHPFHKLQNLKKLIIKVADHDVDALLVLPFLVEACPNLQRLTIVKTSSTNARKMNSEVRQMAKKPHQRLEVVEIVEYHEGARDLELAMYFIQNCVALKKLVITLFKRFDIADDEMTEKNAARNRVRQQLEPITTPVGVELVIL